MLSGQLSKLLAPFKLIVNRAALSSIYKNLELSPDLVRGCSNYAILEAAIETGINEKVYVETATFLAVIDSLPSDEECELKVENNVLHWRCGSAKGKLATIPINDMPVVEDAVEVSHVVELWQPTESFVEALELGALSCRDDTLATVGMYGIVLDNRDGGKITVASSDNVTISACSSATGNLIGPGLSYFSPDSLVLLRALTNTHDGGLSVSETSAYYMDDKYKALIKQLPPLSTDIKEIYSPYLQGETIAKIPRDRIGSFIKRATALAENKKHTYVMLGATKGKLLLEFTEGTAASEEHYLVDGLDVPDMAQIKLDASKVIRALAHVDEVILDHIGRNAITFRAADGSFNYMVSARV